ncbi:MAG: thiamine diphosphokinase [Bacteroidales bacterium]
MCHPISQSITTIHSPSMSTVILANGRFPTHPIPIGVLHKAKQIICCDGAVNHLVEYGLEPTAIVGDLDSVSPKQKELYADRLFFDPNQETNDLTKAVTWCKENGYNNVKILAGTGKRDDHTLGNIGLLTKYLRMGVHVELISDSGTIVPLLQSSRLESFTGQQVSIFSFNNSTRITTHNLKYPINNMSLSEPWMGTLNMSMGGWFEVEFDIGPIVVFRGHKE